MESEGSGFAVAEEDVRGLRHAREQPHLVVHCALQRVEAAASSADGGARLGDEARVHCDFRSLHCDFFERESAVCEGSGGLNGPLCTALAVAGM